MKVAIRQTRFGNDRNELNVYKEGRWIGSFKSISHEEVEAILQAFGLSYGETREPSLVFEYVKTLRQVVDLETELKEKDETIRSLRASIALKVYREGRAAQTDKANAKRFRILKDSWSSIDLTNSGVRLHFKRNKNITLPAGYSFEDLVDALDKA